MVDLQRGVLDPEAVVQQPLELAAGLVAVVASTSTWAESAGKPDVDLPDVQIVHLDHAGLLGQGLADGLDVDALRRGLEEDAAAGLQEERRPRAA